MNDWNSKTWIIVFLVAIGGMFELLKRLPAQAGDQSAWVGDGVKAEAVSPYSVRGLFRAIRSTPAARPAGAHVGGLTVKKEELEKFIASNTPPQQTEFSVTEKGAEGKDPKKAKKKKKIKLADDEEWEYFTDPMTGKRYRRKKKKDLVKQEQVKPATEDTEKEKDDSVADLMNEVINSGTVTPPPDQADKPYADLEEWIRLLLTRPNPTETRRFIDQYLSRLVTADVFYKIVDMMLDDSRAEMKELGLVCAGSTPSLMSFNILAEVTRTQPGSSALRTSAEKLLAQYSTLGNLHVLERVLRSPTLPFNTVLATNKLEIAANTFLAPSANKPPKGISSSSGPVVHSNAVYFQKFVVILESLTKSSEASVKAAATHTLASLQTLLGTPGPVVNPTAQTGDGNSPTLTQVQ